MSLCVCVRMRSLAKKSSLCLSRSTTHLACQPVVFPIAPPLAFIRSATRHHQYCHYYSHRPFLNLNNAGRCFIYINNIDHLCYSIFSRLNSKAISTVESQVGSRHSNNKKYIHTSTNIDQTNTTSGVEIMGNNDSKDGAPVACTSSDFTYPAPVEEGNFIECTSRLPKVNNYH